MNVKKRQECTEVSGYLDRCLFHGKTRGSLQVIAVALHDLLGMTQRRNTRID